jgi:outer membrane murein-binding lipoprotein Lpp
MNEKDLKPHLESLKKDPSLSEILNFSQAVLKKLPEDTNEKVSELINPPGKSELNTDSLNSLLTAVQGVVNPTTLSMISKTLNNTEIKKEESNTTSLNHKLDQLSSDLGEVREQLDATKALLAEQSSLIEELKETVQSLKRRRRR